MIVPRRHVGDPEHLAPDEYAACAEMVRRATASCAPCKRARQNVGMNSAGRRCPASSTTVTGTSSALERRTNFMPVLAGVKVMSEHSPASYDRLAPALRAAGDA